MIYGTPLRIPLNKPSYHQGGPGPGAGTKAQRA